MAGGTLRRKAPKLAVTSLDPTRYLPIEPRNENGVVYVFALSAKRLGFDVRVVRAGFPDCIAQRDGKRVRIEFEFLSSNFRLHGHDPSRCDAVVCWKHDDPTFPQGLELIEMRKLFGLARDV